MANKGNNEFQNTVAVTGYVHSMNFRTGTSKATSKWHPNENYISGNLHVATDDSAMNVVPVNFFVYENRNDKDGNTIPNETYQTLVQIMNGPTFEDSGTKATKVRITGSVDSNDFYSTRTDEVIQAQRVNGRFIHIAQPGINVTPASFDVKARSRGTIRSLISAGTCSTTTAPVCSLSVASAGTAPASTLSRGLHPRPTTQ